MLPPRAQTRSTQAGAAFIFFAMVLLPLLAVLMSITLDLGRYFRRAQQVQKGLDESGLYAHQFVPFATKARSAAEDYLTSIELRDGATVEVSDRGINIAYAAEFPLQFPRLLGLDVALPISAFSQVRSTPYDVFIAFDASSFLAPPLLVDPTTGNPQIRDGSGTLLPAWDSPIGAGAPPPAAFVAARNGLGGGRAYCEPFSGADRTRCQQLITQQCFNHPLIEIKRGAAILFETFSASAMNNVGLAFFPSSVNGMYRTLHRTQPGNDQVVQPFFLDDPAIGNQRDGGNFVANVDCAVMADYSRAVGVTPRYEFLEAPTAVPHPEDPNRPQFIVNPDTLRADSSYLPNLLAREAIWSVAARSPTQAGGEVTVDTAELIRQAYVAVTTAHPLTARGGLVNDEVKRIFLILGGMPRMVNATGGVTKMASVDTTDPVANKLRMTMAEIRASAEQYQQRVNLQIFLVGYNYSDASVPHITADPEWWNADPPPPMPLDFSAVFGPSEGDDYLITGVYFTQEPADLRTYFINRATDIKPVGVVGR